MLLWNVHMKDEANCEKFRSDLGRKGVYPLCFLKSVEVIDSRSVVDIQKTGVGKAFDICGLKETVVRKCLRMAEWVGRLGLKRAEWHDGREGPADKVMPFLSAS
jgi:hypothetical protein